MEINRNNYEAWLLDLIEGRLNAQEAQRVRDFLLLNPDCAEGLDGEEAWVLESGNVSFHGKAMLKKEFPTPDTQLTESNYALFSIARLEEDLTPEQVVEHNRVTGMDDEMKLEWNVWQQTKLVGTHVTFKGKEQLKRKSPRVIRVIWLTVVSAAAALAIILTLIRIEPELTGPVSNNPVAVSESEAVPDASSNGEDPIEKPMDKPAFSQEVQVTARNAGILSIKKHQDPPELTGKGTPLFIHEEADSSRQQVREQDVATRPLRFTKVDNQLPPSSAASYDRINIRVLANKSISSSASVPTEYTEPGLRHALQKYARKKDISLASIASAGMEGINSLTGSDLALNVAKDQEGDVSGFRFSSRWLNVSAPIEKSE